MKFWCVGGFVRDLVLDKQPKDADYVITGSSVEELELLGLRQVGADFPVFLHPIHKSELALARRERKISSGYLGFECETDDVSLEEDLSRRDFTFNAMAIEIHKMDVDGFPILKTDYEIIDPFDGIKDIRNETIRHIGPAFSEDPVRALRACRFAARYLFDIASETELLIKEMKVAGELDSLVPERIWLEINKVLNSPNAYIFFKYMKFLGIDSVIHGLTFNSNFANTTRYSIEQQTILLGLSNNNEELFDIFEKLKVPNDCQTATRKFLKIKDILAAPKVENFMQIVECLELTHTRKWLYILSPIIEDFFPSLHRNWDIVNDLLQIMDISFDELTVKQKMELKGPKIAEAIRELRIKFIEQKLEKWSVQC